jgi:hypothetical protein
LSPGGGFSPATRIGFAVGIGLRRWDGITKLLCQVIMKISDVGVLAKHYWGAWRVTLRTATTVLVGGA